MSNTKRYEAIQHLRATELQEFEGVFRALQIAKDKEDKDRYNAYVARMKVINSDIKTFGEWWRWEAC